MGVCLCDTRRTRQDVLVRSGRRAVDDDDDDNDHDNDNDHDHDHDHDDANDAGERRV